jgi:mannosyltransferase OCH1-like enzyme
MKGLLNAVLNNSKINKIKKNNENDNLIISINEKLKIPYPLKESYNIIIPTNIYQTWHTKLLPYSMANSVKLIKSLNPRFNHYLYDDNDCREFIKNNFKPDVLNAYDSLIPGAYKADLWRYCILFINGGIYLDIKYSPLNGFKFINLTESEHLVADINNIGIYNALMVCLPRNEVLFKAIRQIVKNVRNKYYGDNFLEPTGPNLLSKFISTSDKIVDLKHKELIVDNNYRVIYFNDIPILKTYHGHCAEAQKYSIKQHYSILWNNRKVYK